MLRRSATVSSLALTLALGLAACDDRDAAPDAPGAAAGQRTLNVLIWSEYMDPAIVTQFEGLTGARVDLDVYEDSESMSAKMAQQGGQYDLLIASDYKVPELVELGQVQPLDPARLENEGNIAERFRNPGYDPEGRYSLPYQWGTVGIMYRKDRLPEGFPRSWAIVFDPSRQVGRFTLIDDMRDAFAAALKYRGETINTVDPEKIRAAADDLLTAKGSQDFVAFAGGSSEAPAQVASGNVDLAIVYSGDAFKHMAEDEAGNLGYFVPREGGEIWTDAMLLPAGAKDADLAYRFIDYLLDPQIGAQLSNWNMYATPNQAAMQYIDPEQRADPAIYPPEETMQKLEALRSVGEAERYYTEAWTAVKAQ